MPTLTRGDVWWALMPAPAGRRPVLILTRTAVLGRRNYVTVAPITRTRRGIASEVNLSPADGVRTDCAISLDGIATIPRTAFQRKITSLNAAKLTAVFQAIHYAFDLPF